MMSTLDQIYSSSGAEFAATCLAQAPAWVRALRDIRECDTTYVWRGRNGSESTSEDIIVPEGEIRRLTSTNGFRISTPGTHYDFGTWQVRAGQSGQPGREILEVVTGDEWHELLYTIGTWTLEDGVVVHMDRERGIWRDRG
jgi:hypothetical protein